MINVSFNSFDFDLESQKWAERPIAELVVDGDELTLSGPHADWIDLDIAVVDPESGERITRELDAERWARLLPFAFRSGEISVEVSEVAELALAEPAAAFHYPVES